METQFKLCSRCKGMIPLKQKGSLCSSCLRIRQAEKIEYLKDKGLYTEVQKVYNSPRYRRARQQCLRRAKGLCEVCLTLGVRTAAKEAHHIIKVINGDETTHYSLDNLVAVCEDCHKKIEGLNHEELYKYLLDQLE